MALVAAAIAASAVVGGASSATGATTYPTWNDVEQARHSTAATKALIAELSADIAGLDDAARSAQATAQTLGTAAQQADQAYQEQYLAVHELQRQQDAAAQRATTADDALGRLIATEYRSDDGDATLQVLLDAGSASDRLASLGLSEKLEQQFGELRDAASAARSSVAALKDQADAAAAILQTDKTQADASFATAAQAAQRATAALAAQQSHEADLEALLVIAQQKQSTTLAQYNAGVAARAAAAAKARRQQSSGDPGTIVGGWTLPARGPITSPYGWRIIFGAREFHLGTDIGAACGAPEYAAHAGTVTYAGWNGVYGYYVAVDVGGGVTIEYGHIEANGILVGLGDHVAAGQVISRVGTTGTSTGCHLFYGVRVNGVVTDPQPFMQARGVTLGG